MDKENYPIAFLLWRKCDWIILKRPFHTNLHSRINVHKKNHHQSLFHGNKGLRLIRFLMHYVLWIMQESVFHVLHNTFMSPAHQHDIRRTRHAIFNENISWLLHTGRGNTCRVAKWHAVNNELTLMCSLVGFNRSYEIILWNYIFSQS